MEQAPQKENQNFTHLVESLLETLQIVLKVKLITLPKLKHNPCNSKRPWYKEDEFYDYNIIKGHSTNGCKILK